MRCRRFLPYPLWVIHRQAFNICLNHGRTTASYSFHVQLPCASIGVPDPLPQGGALQLGQAIRNLPVQWVRCRVCSGSRRTVAHRWCTRRPPLQNVADGYHLGISDGFQPGTWWCQPGFRQDGCIIWMLYEVVECCGLQDLLRPRNAWKLLGEPTSNSHWIAQRFYRITVTGFALASRSARPMKTSSVTPVCLYPVDSSGYKRWFDWLGGCLVGCLKVATADIQYCQGQTSSGR